MGVRIGNAWLVSFEDSTVVEKGAVRVEGGRIVALGRDAEVPCFAGDEQIDAGGRLVCPGFVNLHAHLYSTFATGLAVGPASNFVQVLETLWWRLDKGLTLDDAYGSALVPLTRSVRKGFTCVFDHHASPNAVDGSLDRIDQARAEVGLRAVLAYEVSDRDGAAIRDAGIAENLRFARAAKAREDGMTAGAFGLHASFTLSDETLGRVAAEGDALAAGLHVHVAEDKADVALTRERSGQGILARFDRFGLLNGRSLCAHGVHLDEAELDLLAARDGILIHNPQSNLNNAVGFLDLVGRDLGRPLTGLGSDGMTMGLFEEARASIWMHHHLHAHPQAAFLEPVSLLTRNNFAAARRFLGHGIGRLAVGAPADLVIFDYLPYTPLTPENLAGHLVFGVSQVEARDVLVSGRWVLRDRAFPHLDEERIAARAREQAAALWKRIA
jgi:putative selenium metabolism protein SsnA